jgi:hypothetical protein
MKVPRPKAAEFPGLGSRLQIPANAPACQERPLQYVDHIAKSPQGLREFQVLLRVRSMVVCVGDTRTTGTL